MLTYVNINDKQTKKNDIKTIKTYNTNAIYFIIYLNLQRFIGKIVIRRKQSKMVLENYGRKENS